MTVSRADLRTQFAIRDWEHLPLADQWGHRGLAKNAAGELDDEQRLWAFRKLVDLPHKSIRVADFPDGRYMIDDRRYHVFTRKGFTMVKRTDARGKDTGGLLRYHERLVVLVEIGRNPQEAAVRYGLHTRRCPYCHQELDNEISLRVGAGRKCAEDHGITWA